MNSPLSELLKNGALIIDLRPKASFEKEHISGSLNIPFDKLNSTLLKSNFVKFRRQETVITCSDQATESTAAKAMLESQGMLTVYDGGDWAALQRIAISRSEL